MFRAVALFGTRRPPMSCLVAFSLHLKGVLGWPRRRGTRRKSGVITADTRVVQAGGSKTTSHVRDTYRACGLWEYVSIIPDFCLVVQ